MATLVLTAVGTHFGGPVGGAIGSFVGRQIDGAIFGGPNAEGPRLKDLAVSTSSYGQPIPRHFGQVRSPGTIFWSTDLKESREKSGGGKGKPSTTTYSYSVSFAVALASRPIDGIGRIWADGNLLRGAAGDLKTGGTLRIHDGFANQEPDPLLSAALGDRCPAHRGCAYVVFEDLSLADFGNRIPALTFEIFAGQGDATIAGVLDGTGSAVTGTSPAGLIGFSHEGGRVGALLGLFDRLAPIVPLYEDGSLKIDRVSSATGPVPMLPLPAVWSDGEFGRESGSAHARKDARSNALAALRYFDPERDYQPGLQRVDGGRLGDASMTLEFPGVLQAPAARSLLRSAATRHGISQETLAWRVAQLDPALRPGSVVRAPGTAGTWLVAGWEWRESGVELELVRHLELDADAATDVDPGTGWRPRDRFPKPTRLRVFETPWDGIGSSEAVRLYAAVSSADGPWPGAALYSGTGTNLEPVGTGPVQRAIAGELSQPLSPSSAVRFEAAAQIRLRLYNEDSELRSTDTDGIARGANRLLVGSEVIQFAHAEPEGDGAWVLTGLLRGRGGTEQVASAGHEAGAGVTLLDDALILLDGDGASPSGSTEFAAIGLADTEPVHASLENQGASRRPPSPCHGTLSRTVDGALLLGWVRRARGGWNWLDEVEQPIVEQSELYEIGIGSAHNPHRTFSSSRTEFEVPAAILGELEISFPGAIVWVRQCGSFGKSQPLRLGELRIN